MFVSILGDSLSTYEGYNPDGYEVFYDKNMQEWNDIRCVNDTWWMKVIQKLHANLCVNNSFSGSMVSGHEFPSACCQERLMNLRTGECTPDLILIYIGFNDFGCGVPISCVPMRNDGSISLDCFEDAYCQMLTGLRYYYPKAKIVCATLLRTTMEYDGSWIFPDRLGGISIDEYNEAIRRAAAYCHVALADLAKRHLDFSKLAFCDRRYKTLDGTHATAKGHQEIADQWIGCLSKIL